MRIAMLKRVLYIIMCALIVPFALNAQKAGGAQTQTAERAAEQPANDSVVVSLLTCTPGQLVYELYGHTAIRVREVGTRQSDWVFNYGTFSFDQPHFIWRFLLGQTDYELGVVPYAFFYDFYMREGRGIEEQRLNLTRAEATQLVDALSKNLEPENATYRYNFFKDNCTTRALAMIEKSVQGKVLWPKADEGKTLRGMVHEYSAKTPWNKFGQDLLVGSEADELADLALQKFAPLYAERFMDEALVRNNDGTTRHLAAPAITLLPAQPMATGEAFPLTPMWVFGLLFAVSLAVTLAEWRKGKYYWGFDVLLFLAQGLTGCIVAFLFFFSAHPTVESNWLVLLFNPLPLVLFPWYMKSASARKRSLLVYVESVMLAATLLVGIAGLQSFPAEVYLIIIALALRMANHWRTTAKPQEK